MQRKWTNEQANLLAMAQIMTRLRYNDPSLLETLGGKQALIESPLIQEIEAASKHECIGLFLEGRFGAVPQELTAQLANVLDREKLRELSKFAATCKDIKAFGRRLKKMQ